MFQEPSKLVYLPTVSLSSTHLTPSVLPLTDASSNSPIHAYLKILKRLSIILEIKGKHFSLTHKALLNLILLASQTSLSLSTGLWSFEHTELLSALGMNHFLGLYFHLTITWHSTLILNVTSPERPRRYSMTWPSLTLPQSFLSDHFVWIYWLIFLFRPTEYR